MGCIYKITNQVNGKMYIGKTEDVDPQTRWKEHLRDYKKERNKNRPLYKAFKKYGVENFAFDVIDKEDDPDKLCNLEVYYINRFRTYVGFEDCNGYNATLGGDGKSYLRFDEKSIIEYHVKNGYITSYTAKHFNVDRHTIKKILVKNGITWLSDIDLTRKKFLNKYGGLVQIDGDEQKIVRVWECPMDVYLECPDFHRSGFSSAYRINQKSHKYKGYYWYRLNELPEEYKPLLELYYKDN